MYYTNDIYEKMISIANNIRLTLIWDFYIYRLIPYYIWNTWYFPIYSFIMFNNNTCLTIPCKVDIWILMLILKLKWLKWLDLAIFTNKVHITGQRFRFTFFQLRYTLLISIVITSLKVRYYIVYRKWIYLSLYVAVIILNYVWNAQGKSVPKLLLGTCNINKRETRKLTFLSLATLVQPSHLFQRIQVPMYEVAHRSERYVRY